MSKKRWSIDEKKQHVNAWWASGLIRVQYCELHAIPFKSLSQWPQNIAKAERQAPSLIELGVHYYERSIPAFNGDEYTFRGILWRNYFVLY
ncbi:TPA: hypothetical protein ACF913_000025 [Salmonella enterica subsp. enterica serovar Newport]